MCEQGHVIAPSSRPGREVTLTELAHAVNRLLWRRMYRAPAAAGNNSYPPFLLTGLWITDGVAAQRADAKHIFPRASLRVSVGGISDLHNV